MKTGRTISEKEIQYLFDFVNRKRVRYYDLQVEIVDHLASAIEEKWSKRPALSFEKALDEVYSTFGIFGFAKVVEARERGIQKRALREIGRFFKSLANPARLWVPLVIVLALFQLFLLLPDEQLHFYLMLVTFFLFLPVVVFSFKNLYQAKKRKGKSFLILQMPAAHSGGAGTALYMAVWSWTNLPFEFEMVTDTVLFILAVLITVVWLYAYAAAVHLPRRAEEMLQEQFPDYAR